MKSPSDVYDPILSIANHTDRLRIMRHEGACFVSLEDTYYKVRVMVALDYEGTVRLRDYLVHIVAKMEE